MDTILPGFQLTTEDVNTYREKGFVVLRSVFTKGLIDALRENAHRQFAAPTDRYQRGFDQLMYDTCVGNEVVYSLLRDGRFRAAMQALTGRDMFFTQAAGFRVRQKVSAGLAWHIESQSFGYQRAEDDATTLWVPFNPIRASGQRGGMRCVSRSVLCGKFLYAQVAPAMFRYVQDRIREGGLPFEEYEALRNGTLNGEPLRSLLEHHAEEPDFEIGDVLLMSKYVVHRSVVLGEGPMAAREACAFRFVDVASQYDRERALDLEIPRAHYGYAGPTRFHLDVCQNDGDSIVDSPLFDQDRAIRHLGASSSARDAIPLRAATDESGPAPARRALHLQEAS